MRIWVTGIGIVSPLAPDSRSTMDRLCRGDRAFQRVTLFDVDGQRTEIAAEVPNVRVADVVPPGVDPAYWSRTDAFAILAAREALAEAKLTPADARIDLVVGTTTGATFETEQALADLLLDASAPRLTPPIVHPLALTVDHVAAALGPFRRRRLVSSACSTGANALTLAASWLRGGRSERVLAGACDSLCRLTFTGFNALGSLDPEPCRPFDASRGGLGLGEGAAFLLLERDDVARARGVEPIAELIGWAGGAEAHHITNPEPQGNVAARAMRQALERGAASPDDVDYVNAHGTATALNDPMEIRAVRQALGPAFERVAISSVKGQIGHSLGAAGAVEAAITALAISQKRVPPTGGLVTPAEDCQANHIIGTSREMDIRVALSSSFGFGGLDGVIALARPGYAPEPDEQAPRTVWVRGGAVAVSNEVRTIADPAWAGRPSETPSGPLGDGIIDALDLSRSRRLARAERLLAAVIGAVDVPTDAASTGLVVGKPSGNPDATSRFLDRIRTRGPRFASPAEFPNLMLSSLAGHVSIYHRLEGLALATSSQGGSGTSCLRTALELLAAGPPDQLFAGSVDPWGMAAEADAPGRSEGAAAVLLDARSEASDKPLARLRVVEDLDELAAPGLAPHVLLSGDVDPSFLGVSPWSDIPTQRMEELLGRNESVAVAAVVLAVGSIVQGSDRVLVLAADGGEPILFVVERP